MWPQRGLYRFRRSADALLRVTVFPLAPQAPFCTVTPQAPFCAAAPQCRDRAGAKGTALCSTAESPPSRSGTERGRAAAFPLACSFTNICWDLRLSGFKQRGRDTKQHRGSAN